MNLFDRHDTDTATTLRTDATGAAVVGPRLNLVADNDQATGDVNLGDTDRLDDVGRVYTFTGDPDDVQAVVDELAFDRVAWFEVAGL